MEMVIAPGADCALNALAIDKPLEHARLYINGLPDFLIKQQVTTK